ncbi:Fungal specific transcription factor domain-containing protein [Cladophialophora immunda]|nr:Fungal specific transcription factor domain-containing protein [Cladophialophora immunda]
MADHLVPNVCPTCSKSYKRPEHLRRHQLSHGSERPYVCVLCRSTFQRSDVLKRHLKTCDTTADTASESSEPHPKRVALSQSSPVEDAVLSFPCPPAAQSQLLVDKDRETSPVDVPADSFEHIAGWISCGLSPNHGFDDRSDIWQDFLNFNSGTQTPRAGLEGPEEDIGSLCFLDTFTSTTGFVSSFDCGTLEQRRRVNAYFSDATKLASLERSSTVQAASADPSGLYMDDASCYETDEEHPAGTTLSRWLSDPLSFKCHEIVTSIRNIVLHKSRKSYITLSWSPTIHETCAQFFSPANVRRFVQLYWAVWHPNVNIVHKSTFDLTHSKAEVLAAMSLIGACVSPDPADLENAKRWFNCVEEMVFDDEDFCDDPPNVLPHGAGDNWEGTTSSKRRIRRQRFSMVIAAARDVGIHNARHPDYCQMNLCDFSFDAFAVIEELIRVLLWVFLLDTAFVIFNNLPPRMVIREMRMNAACSEACFQATTAEECFKTLQHQQQADLGLGPKVADDFTSAFELLYRTDLDESLSVALADLGPLNLFAMTSALHSLIFHHQSSFSCQGSLDPIHSALQSWRKVWHVYLGRFSRDSRHSTVKCDIDHLAPDDMWRRVGFMRHAHEYWYLANLMVERLSAPPPAEAAETAVETSKQAQSPLSASGNETISPLLDKYDETSMQQVNTLISDFQMFRIH